MYIPSDKNLKSDTNYGANRHPENLSWSRSLLQIRLKVLSWPFRIDMFCLIIPYSSTKPKQLLHGHVLRNEGSPHQNRISLNHHSTRKKKQLKMPPICVNWNVLSLKYYTLVKKGTLHSWKNYVTPIHLISK